MATPERLNKPYTYQSEQGVLNESRDEEFKILAVEPVEFDGVSLRRKQSDITATRLDDTSTATTTYIGKAPVGSLVSSAVWQIAKLDTSSGLIKTWSGNAGFTQVWADRTSLTYS